MIGIGIKLNDQTNHITVTYCCAKVVIVTSWDQQGRLWAVEVPRGKLFSEPAERSGLAERIGSRWVKRLDNAVRTVRNMARESRRSAAIARHGK